LRLTPLFLLIGLKIPLLAQCSLSCNSGLQVSLDPSGQALITPLLLAPTSENSCPGPLTVTLYNQFGQQLPNPLSCDQIGQTVTARVRHTGSGNYCDGSLELFDALSPTLSNCGDQYVFCHEDTSPGAVVMPSATDNCTPPNALNFSHFDLEIPLNCGTYQNGVQVLKQIDRNWTVSDDHGNSSTCLQRIWLKHMTLTDISFPLNRDNISSPALSCGQDPEDFDLTGQPTVNGIPVGASPECELAVTHSDQTIVHCAPAGYTVLRTWTAVDFCSGTISSRIQLIKVVDQEAPQLTAPDNLSIGTDGFYCTGSVTLPQAVYSDDCSAVTVVPSWDYGTGYGPFSGITEGVHLVTYTATDACGNIATATMTITVADSSPPQAICAADLQVSLSSNGVGLVHASTANAGSFDNCSPVFFSISRDEVEYGPWVAITCADQGTPIPLTLRVTDAAGLENFCQMEVTVRDFLKPTVLCPPNLTIHCLQDYTNLSLTGQASASDNCALQSLVYQDVLNLQPCNIGSVTRRWNATDDAGNTRTCIQQITLNAVSTVSVTFPPNITVSSCADPSATLPPATGQPQTAGQHCSPLSVTFTDQVFSGGFAPACYRIFRAWKVIDFCIYDPNDNTTGVWEHTQIIDIVDHTPPVLDLPADLTLNADFPDCTAQVILPDATAADCSTLSPISHDSPFADAPGANASGFYPLGVHQVVFTASDACGNTAQKTLRITVQDLVPPKALCKTGINLPLDATGAAVLNPALIDNASSDHCTAAADLLLTATPTTFLCPQLGAQTITLTVTDAAGNAATCATVVTVIDPLGACVPPPPPSATLGGGIRTETGIPVAEIPLSLQGDGFYAVTDCGPDGNYLFEDVPTGNDYTLRPFSNAQWLNGLTTFDLVLISKHILGLDTLDSPYQLIAADANRSGTVTTFDIVQFRKVILGIQDTVPGNTSWRFVDASWVFPDPMAPAGFPEQKNYSSLAAGQSGQDFVGVKIGDLNHSTNAADPRAPRDTLPLRIHTAASTATTRTLSVYLDNWALLEGFQFELQLDTDALTFESLQCARPDLLDAAHWTFRPDGRLAFSWDNAAAPTPADPLLFTLSLRADTTVDIRRSLRLGALRMAPEAYRSREPEPAALALRFESAAATAALAWPARPNPFLTETALPFYLPEATELRLQVTDAAGKTVLLQTPAFPAGDHEWRIGQQALSVPGAYLYRLSAPGLPGWSGVLVRL